jgi:hypothetical protein
MNPRHPLIARSDTTADTESKRRNHLLQSAAVFRKHDPGSEDEDPQAKMTGTSRFPLPLAAYVRKEVLAPGRLFIQDFVRPVTVISYCRRAQECLRTLVERRDSVHKRTGPSNPAVADTLFYGGIPSLRNRFAREMDNCVCSFNRFNRDGPFLGIPKGEACCARIVAANRMH